MASNVRDQSRQVFDAWRLLSPDDRTFPPNPLHERDWTPSRDSWSEKLTGCADLEAELMAWDEASDEDFERFEQSLE